MIQSIVETFSADFARCRPEEGRNYGERSLRFKCPVSFHSTLPESMFDLLGIEEFNRLETYEYSSEPNSRVDE